MYKFPKFFGYIPYESSSIKFVPSEYWSFIHPNPPVCLDTLLMTPFPTKCARFLPSHSTKKNFKEIAPFRFLLEKKSFVDFPLFWQSRKSWQPRRAEREAQCLGLNMFLSNCWDNFFTMAQAKRKLKKVLSQTFF